MGGGSLWKGSCPGYAPCVKGWPGSYKGPGLPYIVVGSPMTCLVGASLADMKARNPDMGCKVPHIQQ